MIIKHYNTKRVLDYVIYQRGLDLHRFDRYVAMIQFYEMCNNKSVDLLRNSLIDYLVQYNKAINNNTHCGARYHLFNNIKQNGVREPINVFNSKMLLANSDATIEGTNRLIISYVLDTPTIPCLVSEENLEVIENLLSVHYE